MTNLKTLYRFSTANDKIDKNIMQRKCQALLMDNVPNLSMDGAWHQLYI
jgi:hypothetical protein